MEDGSGETYYFHIPVPGPGLGAGSWFHALLEARQLKQFYDAFKGFSAATEGDLSDLPWEDVPPV